MDPRGAVGYKALFAASPITAITVMSKPVLSLQRLVLEDIAAGRPGTETLDRICKLVEEIVPGGLASVMRSVPERGTLVYSNAPSLSPEVLATCGELTPGALSGTCGAAFFERRMVVVEDTSVDPRWQSLRDVAERFGIKSCWSVPIRFDEHTLVGTFAVSLREHAAPTDEQRELLEVAAYLASVVLRVEKAEAATREQTTLLHAVLEGSEDAIFVKDRDGRYLLANRAEARDCGCSPQEMIGKRDGELYGNPLASKAVEGDRHVLETGRSVVHELEVASRHDGVVREYLVRRDPLRDGAGKVIGVVGIARDVTETRRAERALQQAQKLESLGVLASGIAHDFNNLMVGVLGNASLLEDVQQWSDDLGEVVADIRAAAERSVELTAQLMQYAGKRKPERTAVQLPELLREVPHLLGKAFEQSATLEFDFPDELPPVAGDPVQLRQVMMNLILNAGDALAAAERDAGRIQVRAARCQGTMPTGELLPAAPRDTRDWVLVEIADNGVGMDRETRARIFDPFFSTKATGRGLGLAAVLGIIGAHRGCLSVASTPGEGTRFSIWLPVAEVDCVLAPKPTARRGAAGARGRALIIDDEDVVRDAAGRLLRKVGYEPVLAGDGASGVDAFARAEGRFDLVLLDLTMPGMGGHEVLRRLREIAPEVPVVLTSGLGEIACREAVGDQVVDAFLPKPFGVHDIEAMVERVRAAKRLHT